MEEKKIPQHAAHAVARHAHALAASIKRADRMKCAICGATSVPAFSHQILGKYTCQYFHCVDCGFLHTETPYWLNEAYASAIAAADTGLVQRNISLSGLLPGLLLALFGRSDRFLDAAGGYGLLTRLMRDVGFDYYWSDKHCANMLAPGFEQQAGASYAAVTAFEVLEHLADPLGFVRETLAAANSRTMIFSTELFHGAPPTPSWWYYTFATGQHISFYQRRTLEVMAGKLGLRCYSSKSLHMFTDREVSPALFSLLVHHRMAPFFSWVARRTMMSRMVSDHISMLGRGR